MAKDILVNTQSGDWIVSEGDTQATYWKVVWGKLFDSDESEYMNIVVPSAYINKIQYTDNQYECLVQADYNPVNTTFQVRLVVENAATSNYSLIQDYTSNAPEAMGVVYYPTYISRPQDINACQLPAVDVDGRFKILFKRYENSVFSRAIIVSAKNANFTIGESDSQSAQLLAKCAPGTYYRYPTTGLDLTKYINSVVEHTDMTTQLVKQYSGDSKQITTAEFDSSTGDLQIVFSGSDEADDQNLADPSTLDVELFRIADDDFIRTAYKEARSVADNNSAFIEDLVSTDNFMGIYDICNTAKLDDITPTITPGALKNDGSVDESITTSFVATMKVEAGKLYAINYSKKDLPLTVNLSHSTLFALYSNDKVVYIDAPFTTLGLYDVYDHMESLNNRRCFIPLKDLTVIFYAGKSASDIQSTGCGIYPVSDVSGNYNSILGLVGSTITGKLTGMVTNNSFIEDIKIDTKTNQLLIIKQNKE